MLPETATFRRGLPELSGVPFLGAPGVYVEPPTPDQGPDAERLDVAAFVGVAPRGPAYPVVTDPDVLDGQPFRARSVATPVDSWEDYLDLFGGIDGPGLLPHAVASYFSQGGRRAYVVRVVAPRCRGHVDPGVDHAPRGCARLRVGGPGGWRVWARNEGGWGSRLSVEVRLTSRPLAAKPQQDGNTGPDAGTNAEDGTRTLVLPAAAAVMPGATLRVTCPGTAGTTYRKVVALRRGRPGEDGSSQPRAVLDDAVPAALAPGQPSPRFEVVEAAMVVNDADPARPRTEEHLGLGLEPGHPRWVVDVVNQTSRLVQMPPGTPPGIPRPAGQDDPEVPTTLRARLVALGQDRWDALRLEDLFGEADLGRRGGVDAVRLPEVADEVASLVVPDLYAPGAAPATPEPIPEPAHTGFERCDRPAEGTAVRPPPVDLPQLRLDPADPDDRARIVEQQQKAVAAAEASRLVALLDVPPGLTPDQVLSWRASFDSSYAACYTPWLSVPDGAGGLVRLPPSAPAAGVVARTELVHGFARGPANNVLVGVVAVERDIGATEHGLLHQHGVNVCRLDVDGVRLTAARTLSTDAAWRQLTVRRLLMLLDRTVRRRLQWTVFEPDDDQLRDGVHRQLEGLLGSLFEQGCFAGATPGESFFVATATGRDRALEMDQGRLVVEVGVAPSEPLEFVVLRVAVQAEGDLRAAVVGTGTGAGVAGRG